MKDITDIIKDTGITDYELYGRYAAKLGISNAVPGKKRGKIILMTAMTPTPAGEGKTTTAIGLAQALKHLGKSVGIAIREPSLGPCFGVKGGATGGGKSTVEPSDKINLIFTGDFPAISAAHNLLSAMINNHIYFGNESGIDPKKISFPRTVDMDDRSLRSIIVGNGPKSNGVLANDSFVITAASEIMAIMALSKGYDDLKERLGNIIIGYTAKNRPVFARDIKAEGAMAALLADALKPNMVQSAENVPAIIHTGPFGNIAHGTSSILGDYAAMNLFDYTVTEAGFGSDLGFEKFMDIVTREAGINVDAVVIVATIRAMKHHGGAKNIDVENIPAMVTGIQNLFRHVENVRNFGIDPVIALNVHPLDTNNEIEKVSEMLENKHIKFAISRVYSDGGAGGIDLANAVLDSINTSRIKYAYLLDDPVKTKIEKIATKVYGAEGVDFSKEALLDIKHAEENGFGGFYICMAKTQASISDNPGLLNSPGNFRVKVNSVMVNGGSRFIIPVLGSIMTMPGLPKHPAAENIDIDSEGRVTGLS
ncbi:MAG: formate--tetrahydrofolate ligase [Candidatus Thermoplasmatota archaeon]|nr:formate--tetrahydrofolate ligase [Candidatus Thermoplasmatota archaeon]